MERHIFGTQTPLCGDLEQGTAVRRSLWRVLLIALLMFSLVLTLAACEGGYTTSGVRTTSSQTGNRGEIDVSINSANGSTTQDFEFDCADCVVEVEVTLEVQEGTFKLEFLGEDDEVTLTLEASPGQPASGSGYMITDGFGEGEYRVTAAEARGVSYHITYQLR